MQLSSTTYIAQYFVLRTVNFMASYEKSMKESERLVIPRKQHPINPQTHTQIHTPIISWYKGGMEPLPGAFDIF